MAAALQLLGHRQRLAVATAKAHAHRAVARHGREDNRMRRGFFLQQLMHHGVRIANGRFSHRHSVGECCDMCLGKFVAEWILHLPPFGDHPN